MAPTPAWREKPGRLQTEEPGGVQTEGPGGLQSIGSQRTGRS